ncbi:MAG TPA: DUF5668 domain-containing protein [Bacteroidota bacterium]
MEARKSFSAHILIGSFLVLAGGALLLENFGVIDIGPVWRFWPLILIGLGIARIREAMSRSEQGTGLWLLLLGLWFAVSTLHIGGLTFSDTWPAIFIAVGVSLLWRSLPALPTLNQEKEHPHGA